MPLFLFRFVLYIETQKHRTMKNNNKRRKPKTRITQDDILKAVRKGRREAENELEGGFVSTNKVHRSKKTYTRKKKHKNKDS